MIKNHTKESTNIFQCLGRNKLILKLKNVAASIF
jgi:hypothetical protein